MFDDGIWVEHDRGLRSTDPLRFTDTKPYKARLAASKKSVGQKDAVVVGVGRIIRRIAVPVMRAISTPDDYFCLVLLTTWFAFAFLAVCLVNTVGLLLAKFLNAAPASGIRRALGAKRRDIITQFLVESVMLSGTGGVLGVIMGIAIPFIVTAAAGMKTIITFTSLVPTHYIMMLALPHPVKAQHDLRSVVLGADGALYGTAYYGGSSYYGVLYKMNTDGSGFGQEAVVATISLKTLPAHRDWVVDLGPEGGDAGGRIVAAGSPAQIITTKGSYTGEHLRPKLA